MPWGPQRKTLALVVRHWEREEAQTGAVPVVAWEGTGNAR